MLKLGVMDQVKGVKQRQTVRLGQWLHNLLFRDDSLTDVWFTLSDGRELYAGIYQLLEDRRQYYDRDDGRYVCRNVEGLRIDGQSLTTAVTGIGYHSQSHKLILFGSGGRILPLELELKLKGADVARLRAKTK